MRRAAAVCCNSWLRPGHQDGPAAEMLAALKAMGIETPQ